MSFNPSLPSISKNAIMNIRKKKETKQQNMTAGAIIIIIITGADRVKLKQSSISFFDHNTKIGAGSTGSFSVSFPPAMANRHCGVKHKRQSSVSLHTSALTLNS